MDTTKVSVILLAYNTEKYIADCLESLIGQTEPPHEIIVCDDGSKDKTREIVRSYHEKHPELVKLNFQEVNVGTANNLQSGYDMSTGNWLVRMDSDDAWTRDKLEHEVRLIESDPGIDVVYSRAKLIDAEGNLIRSFDKKFTGTEGNVLPEMLTHNLAFRDFLFKKELLDKIGGGSDPNLKTFIDWDFKIRLVSVAKVGFVDKETVSYRLHDQGYSKRNYKVLLASLEYVYEKHRAKIEACEPEMRKKIYARRRRDFRVFSKKWFNQERTLGTLITRMKYYFKTI